MRKKLLSPSLTTWILISLVIGLALGVWFPEFAHSIKPLRTVFLNGVKCIIAPLIFSSIVCGINSSGSMRELGRIGFRAIIWFEIATTAALAIGLFFVNWLRPGDGLSIGQQVDAKVMQASQTKMSFAGFMEHLLPTNFVEAVGKGDVLQIVIFSVIFGLALLMTGPKGRPVLAFCEGLSQVMFKFTELIMKMAPIGVGAAIADGSHVCSIICADLAIPAIKIIKLMIAI